MKKMISMILAVVMLLALLTACGSPAASDTDNSGDGTQDATPIVIRIGHSSGESSDWQQALLVFKEDLEERSNGTLKVEIYPNETLGPELDNITGIQQGHCEGVLSGEALTNWTPYAALVSMPYACASMEAAEKIADSEEIGGVIEKNIIETAKLHPIGYFLRSARNLTSSKEIRSFDDVAGLKIRVPNNKLSIALWTAFGASATPMAWSEVFTSLQNGTIQAQENPSTTIYDNNLFEVQDYLIKTEHTISWIYVCLGEDFWQSLTAEQQNMIDASAKVMNDWQHDYLMQSVDEVEAKLGEKMTIIDIDKTPFIEAALQVVKEEVDADVYALYEKMVEMGK